MLKRVMRGNRPTRTDVAKRAGVAPSTVTLILNDRSMDLGIKDATRKRVEEAAKELGYYPNRHIRAIRSGRTGTFGLYLRSDQWGVAIGYWAMMVAGLERAVSEADLQLLVHCAPEGCLTEEAYARQAGGAVDGVLILNSGQDPIAQRLMDTGMRAVEIGDCFSPLPYVAVDAAQGVRLLVDHLKEKGYKRPAFVNFLSPYEESSRQRRDAFREAGQTLYGRELPCFDVRHGVEGLEQLLASDFRPDCAVCTSDELAHEIRLAARSRSIRVPEELALTGFDCIQTVGAEQVMTSVQTPLNDLSRLAVAKLQAMVAGKPFERETVLPVSLRVGMTT
jgi:DNA-binding LacI/PurR family transcriptional regulator